jgi:hypothetical protein
LEEGCRQECLRDDAKARWEAGGGSPPRDTLVRAEGHDGVEATELKWTQTLSVEEARSSHWPQRRAAQHPYKGPIDWGGDKVLNSV